MRVLVAFVGALVVLGVTSCGKPSETGSTVTTTSKPLCSVGLGEPEPSADCVYVDPDAGIAANNAYRDYKPVPPGARAAADEVAKKVPAVLEAVRAQPPVTTRTVSQALQKAFPEYESEVSERAARIVGGVGYGLSVEGACVHGWVMDTDQAVTVDGLFNDGGCLPLLGH